MSLLFLGAEVLYCNSIGARRIFLKAFNRWKSALGDRGGRCLLFMKLTCEEEKNTPCYNLFEINRQREQERERESLPRY